MEPTQQVRRDNGEHFFSGFTFDGHQRLESLASFYGFTADAMHAGATLADYLTRFCRGKPQAGFRLPLGAIELVVLELREGHITKVGLGLSSFQSYSSIRRIPGETSWYAAPANHYAAVGSDRFRAH